LIRIRKKAGLLLLLGVLACAPVMPERSKPGGAARWAHALATDAAVRWSRDALLVRVVGSGVGTEGWLPDRGGTWILTYQSREAEKLLEVIVDTNGKVFVQKPEGEPFGDEPQRPLPAEWVDSPRAWAATSSHQIGVVLNTFEAELAYDADAENHPGELVWRLRFYMQGGEYETHVVNVEGRWLAMY
jgi:hypothetical protein